MVQGYKVMVLQLENQLSSQLMQNLEEKLP